MTLPTLNEVTSTIADVWKRFYLPVLAGFTGTVSAIILNHLDFSIPAYEVFLGITMTAVFAFPLLLATDLLTEGFEWKSVKRIFAEILALVVSVFLYFYLFRHIQNWSETQAIQAFVLNVSAWLAVLFTPYIGKFRDKKNSFWQHDMIVWERLVISFVIFGLLFAGVAALIASIDFLFALEIEEEIYADVWFVITGLLVANFFLAGIPKDFAKLERSSEYPNVVKFLTQYILVPLVSVYFVVLYVYTGKTVLTWEWPEGGTAWWIIAFSIVGVIAYFFASAEKEKFHHYVEVFKKWFFVVLIPMVLVLFMAIGLRIEEYGVTEQRYLVVVFGIWLLINAAYFLISKKKDLKVGVWTLFVGALISVYGGPISAFQISENSQRERLEKILMENDILVNGRIEPVPADKSIDIDVAGEISDKVLYLMSAHGVERFEEWLDVELVDSDAWLAKDEMLDLMGLDYVMNNYHGYERSIRFYDKDSCYECAVDVDGYQYFVSNSYLVHSEKSWTDVGSGYELRLDNENDLIIRNEARDINEAIDLSELVLSLEAKVSDLDRSWDVSLDSEDLEVDYSGEKVNAKLRVLDVSFRLDDQEDGSLRISELNTQILWSEN